jgi:uncharacterized membrane protein SpoIIM required for sporulation
MTPLQFERNYAPAWQAFEQQLDGLQKSGGWLRRRRVRTIEQGPDFAAAYRQCCEHLALARDRNYPLYLVERLERLTAEGHQYIYRQSNFGLDRLASLALREFPRAVRAHRAYVALATALLVVPLLLLLFAVRHRPELVTTVVDPNQASQFERMYSSDAQSIGRVRGADTDLKMFGYYIRHNIGIAFQCFAGGIFLGLGSIWFLLENGFFAGAIAGYVTARGLGGNFYPFVATHSAFELTATVLAGAAGLRLGHALLAPGRHTRARALAIAGGEVSVIIYGVVAMLLIAAAIEAFWSSSQWLPVPVKYASAAVCWSAVLLYLSRQGRDAD